MELLLTEKRLRALQYAVILKAAFLSHLSEGKTAFLKIARF